MIQRLRDFNAINDSVTMRMWITLQETDEHEYKIGNIKHGNMKQETDTMFVYVRLVLSCLGLLVLTCLPHGSGSHGFENPIPVYIPIWVCFPCFVVVLFRFV